MRAWLLLGLMSVGVGCAGQAPPAEAPCDCPEATSQAAQDAQPARNANVIVDGIVYDSEGRAQLPPTRAPSRSLRPIEPVDRFEVRSLGMAKPPSPPRPRRVGRRDIAVRAARLDNALRVIADAGRFNLVTQGALKEKVTLQLKGVEPYDALLALAEAHDLDVRYKDGIVVARASR